MKYANGIVMTEQPFYENSPNWQGIKFIGDKRWLRVARGYIECSDSSFFQKQVENIPEGQYEINVPHMQNFLDCIRSGERPTGDIEIGHKSTMLCHLGNIAYRTGNTLHLNPVTGKILDNPKAEALLRKEYRQGWTPKV